MGDLPSQYMGFTWSTGWNGWRVISEAEYPDQARPSSGDKNIIVDENEMLFVHLTDATESFNLNSLFIGEALRFPYDPSDPFSHHKLVTISATGLGGETYSTTFLPDTASMSKVELSWMNINSISFSDVSGRLLLDDLSVTATPEPSTIVLVASGLFLVFLVRRRRTS